jgi:2-polyprenyl-6-methoxyphenol hydroxylase-like FAD-dependent oxidoreductase
MTADLKRWTVAIVGGSLPGLAAATELSRVTNADITVFEQTAGRLEGRGAGIATQPEIERLLSISGIQLAKVSVPLREPWPGTPHGSPPHD